MPSTYRATPGRAPEGPLGRLGRWAATHRRAVALAWIGVAVCLGVLAPRAEHALSGGGWQADGSQSVEARRVIDRDFGGLGSYALAVVVSSQTRDSASPDFRAGEFVDRLRSRLPDGAIVGGAAAEARDLEHALALKLPLVYGLVVAVGFALLVLVVRAPLGARAAVLMNGSRRPRRSASRN